MGPGGWNDHMDGAWWWIPMMLMWVVIVGGLVWIGLAALRRLGNFQHPYFPASTTPPPPVVARQAPQEILAERLARGEIEPDDYRRRLDALNPPTTRSAGSE